MSINVIDNSEAQYGVLVGDKLTFVDESTYQFFANYNPDNEGTEDHPDVISPNEPDLPF